MGRRLVVVLGCVCVVALALLAWSRRDSSRTSSDRPGSAGTVSTAPPGDARTPRRVHLDELARARLRERILAGNARLAAARADAGTGSAAPGPGPAEDSGSGSGDPAAYTRNPAHGAYHDEVFGIVSGILEDCRAASPDAGDRIKVSYVVIADDTEGGLFERVELPADSNTSGPETLECITERMLGATLPPPHTDIARFMFDLEVELLPHDAGP